MGDMASTRLCRYCEKEKSWIYSGKKLRDGSKIYTDHSAARWAGRRCPDCERSRVQAAVRCNAFEKELILEQLRCEGFTPLSSTSPLTVEKDGRLYAVGIKQAAMSEGKLIFPESTASESDLYALVFTSVKVCTAAQLAQIEAQYPSKKHLSKGAIADEKRSHG